MVEINIRGFYNNPSLYRFMPESIFAALEKAYIKGDDTTKVSQEEYDEMILKSRK